MTRAHACWCSLSRGGAIRGWESENRACIYTYARVTYIITKAYSCFYFQIIRSYTLKDSDQKADSFFGDLAVDVDKDSCDDAYAYLSDLGGYGLVVYSWAQNNSWRFHHNFFHFDPLNGKGIRARSFFFTVIQDEREYRRKEANLRERETFKFIHEH